MKVFLVKKEFGVKFASTTYCLQDGDLVWTNSKNGSDYIFKAESNLEFNGQKSKYSFNVPVNLNNGGFCYETFRMMPIKDLIRFVYIVDITLQFDRDVKISEICESSESIK